jgi:hypothetical protein
MVVLANLYMAGLLSVPGCSTTLYLAGLAICTWLRYNHYNPLSGWAGIWPWLCWYVFNPLPAWTGYLCLVELQSSTWLGWLSVPDSAGHPLPGWAGYLYLVVLATHHLASLCTWLC